MDNPISDTFADVEIIIAGVGAIVFAASYAAFFRWRITAAGRALMYFVLSLIALLALAALARFTGNEYPGREWIRPVVYSTLVLTVWRLVIVLWSNWRSGAPRPLDIPARDNPRDPDRRGNEGGSND